MGELKHVNKENFFVVQGWMRSELQLSGNALMVYAIIYGFSQTPHQEFTASINYLADWVGCSRRTVFRILDELTESGLIEKESEIKGGVIYNRYRAVRGGVILTQGGDKMTQGGEILSPNNINNKIENKKSKKDKSFLEGQAPISKSFSDIFSDEDNKEIAEALRKFVDYCKGINYRISKINLSKVAKALREDGKNNPQLAMMMVEQAIKNNWKMVYPLKKGTVSNEILEGVVSKRYDPEDVAKDENGNLIVFN